MKRLDILLQERYIEHSRSFLQKLVKGGSVKVDGKVVLKANKVFKDDAIVKCVFPDPEVLKVEPKKVALDVIYEDSEIVVINKSAGITVHPADTAMEQVTLVGALMAHCKDLSGIGGVLRPGIVHRLDRDTSGVLVVAKSDKAHRSLAKQWELRSVHKEYLTLVANRFEQNEGVIDAPIARSYKDRKKMAVSTRHDARDAITTFEVLQTFEIKDVGKFSLVRCLPKTGRTHQIRVHMKSIGHPIIGDAIYGDLKLNSFFKQKFKLVRQFLHAAKLIIKHPTTKKELILEAPLSSDLENVIKKLGASEKGGNVVKNEKIERKL